MAQLSYEKAVIALFSKAPVMGAVKTRLISAIGEAGSLKIHECLLRRTLGTLLEADLCEVQLHLAGDPGHPFFDRYRENLSAILPQRGENLGERMAHSASISLEHFDSVLIVGSDCPVLTAGYLADALAALESGADVVLGPAEDGGYVLIGLREPHNELFEDIDWSTPKVLAQTRARIRLLELREVLLPMLWDLDTSEDLTRFLDLL